MSGPLNDPLSDLTAGKDFSFSDQANKLLSDQKKSWDLLRVNYALLDQVKTRQFRFPHFTIKAQFNPSRIISSSAKVDPKSIAERTCFLCNENLPEQQEKLDIGPDFIILCNPYPIFSEHFTIPTRAHVPQEIKPNFKNLLTLSAKMDKHILFYNGPYCGASAPDHFHFQAGNRSFLPIEQEIFRLKKKSGHPWFSNKRMNLWGINKYPGKFLLLESGNMTPLVTAFNTIYAGLQDITGQAEEPLINILSFYEKQTWQVMIFPRQKHRPSHYFEKGEKNMLISPASVDFGGVFILPREKDFMRIRNKDIIDIFNQTSIREKDFLDLKSIIQGAMEG